MEKEESKRALGNTYQIIWATGKDNYAEIEKEVYEIEGIKGIKIMPYIYNMEEILNISDLAICRSGAMTVTEMLNVEIPAIFIPLPSQNANRQEVNAEVFTKNDMGIIIGNSSVSGEILKESIDKILKDDNILVMKKRLEEYNKKYNLDKNVLDKIYDIISEEIKGK